MINHEHKFIFVHIPKCGGTSIEKIFNIDAFYGDESTFTGWDDQYKFWRTHASIKKIHSQTLGEFKDYFSFAFVRNPWDKCVSEWLWLSSRESRLQDRKYTLKDYLLITHGFNDIESSAEKWGRSDHFATQYSFTCVNNHNAIKFIGRFENLQADFDIVCDKINIPRQQLPHYNKTNHKHYTEYYDEETKQIVAEKFAKDIEYFGYKFGE
jgi:hypothetical protein